MKTLAYLLPLALYTGGCTTFADSDSQAQAPSSLELSFQPYSWQLSAEDMAKIRRFSVNLPSGSTVSLDTCVGGEGHTEHFRRQRAEAVKYFFFPERRDVEVLICAYADPREADKIFVSARTF